MTCPRCQFEIDPAMGVCPQCGSPSQLGHVGQLGQAGHVAMTGSEREPGPSRRPKQSMRPAYATTTRQFGRPAEAVERAVPGKLGESDWRQQIRETVQRRKELRKQQQVQQEQVARQLTIFGDLGDAGRGGAVSEIDKEKDLIRQRRAEIRARVEHKLSQPRNRVRAMVDAGEVAIHIGEVGQTQHAPQLGTVQEAYQTGQSTSGAASMAATLEVDLPEGPMAPEAPDEIKLPHRPRIGSDTMEHFELASPAARLFGGFIDFSFLVLLLLGLAYLTTNLLSQPLRTLPGPAVTALGCVGFLLAAGYFLFFGSLSGQTLGKLLTNSRVVDPLGQPLGFGRAFVRTLGLVVSILPLGAGLVGLWSDIGRRAWHDRLASTKVVRI